MNIHMEKIKEGKQPVLEETENQVIENIKRGS